MILSFVQALCSILMMIAVMTTIDNGEDFRCYTATAFVSLPTTTAMTRTSTVQVLPLSSKVTMTRTNNNNNNNNNPVEERGQPFDPTITKIQWIPMIIKFDHVYKSYGPPSLWRKMTSSVPRREFAVENVTITFGGRGNRNESGNDDDDDNTINLLVGASSSGKSTILKSILETDDEAQHQQQRKRKQSNGNNSNGSIHILPLQKDESTTAMMMMGSSKPILLDDRNDVSNNNNIDDTKTVQDEWTVRVIHELEKLDEQKSKTNSNIKTEATTMKKKACMEQQQQRQQCNLSFAKLLVKEMAVDVFCLDLNKLVVDMTPSEKYRLCLGQACIESSLSRMYITNVNKSNKNKDEIDDGNSSTSNSRTQQQQRMHHEIPGPIILLDEYMDVETSTVTQKVQPSLHRIVSKLNGIVISVTHKPNLYSSSTRATRSTSIVRVYGDDGDNEMQQKQKQQKEQIVRRITLSTGKILSVN